MSTPPLQLLENLKARLPHLEFEGWYEPNFFDMGGFVVRTIKTNGESTTTFDVAIRTDSLEPVDSLADSLVSYIESGLRHGGTKRFRIKDLTLPEFRSLIEHSFPEPEFKLWTDGKSWILRHDYNWNKGLSGSAGTHMGPLYSVAISLKPTEASPDPAIAGWYYKSGIVELDFYPSYQDYLDQKERKIPLEVNQPTYNAEIVRSALQIAPVSV